MTEHERKLLIQRLVTLLPIPLNYIDISTEIIRKEFDCIIRNKDEVLQAVKSANEYLLDSDSIIASCTCCTETNDIKFHRIGCRYRLIVERNQARQGLEACQTAASKVISYNRELQKDCDQFQQRNEQLTKVLHYYADAQNYVDAEYGYQMIAPIEFDKGQKARDVITHPNDIDLDARTKLKETFKALVKEWHDETAGSSLTMRRYAHSSYQRILVLGGKEPAVVGWILEELKRVQDSWFEALRILTNEDPAKDEKTFDGAVKAWLKWGVENRKINP